MDEKKVSITIWGTEKGKWLNWYKDTIEIMNKLEYRHTHIGIMSEHYTTGKIVTVARKEKEIIKRLSEGEIPTSFSLYSLPEKYKIASFDYDFLCERNDSYISVVLNESDYNIDSEELIISYMKKYICIECGEIYSTNITEMPLLYAEIRDKANLETYSLIKGL